MKLIVLWKGYQNKIQSEMMVNQFHNLILLIPLVFKLLKLKKEIKRKSILLEKEPTQLQMKENKKRKLER